MDTYVDVVNLDQSKSYWRPWYWDPDLYSHMHSYGHLGVLCVI